MRRALLLVLIFTLSTLTPLASGATTETQFKDGTTSFSYTFTGTGNGTAGVVSMPYGAEVTAATFNLNGEASTTSWINWTTDDHYGGAGDAYVSSSGYLPSPYTYTYRQNLEVDNQVISLAGTPTTTYAGFDQTSDVSNLNSATINTSGEFIALGDQGYISPTKKVSQTLISQTSGYYRGLVVPISDYEYHVLRYSSSYITSSPTIERVNTSTGGVISTATLNYNSGNTGCGTTGNYYDLTDATIYNDTIMYTTSRNYYILTKWTYTNTMWTCQASYNFGSSNYLTGVDFDDATGKMYVATWNRNSYYHYLNEVNPSSPTVINQSWLMTYNSDYYAYGAGLVVNMPNIIYNMYNHPSASNSDRKSHHYHYTYNSNNGFIYEQGIITSTDAGHYGLVDGPDNTMFFGCHYVSYCSSNSRYIYEYGDGSLFDARTPSQTSQLVIGSAISLTRSVNKVSLDGIFGYMPYGTSIDIDLSVDGGSTWISATPGQTITFPTSGQFLVWRATLNGTSSVSPVLGDLAMSYVTSYQSSGYLYGYVYQWGQTSSVVAAFANWTESVPSGTNINVYFGILSSSSSCQSTSGRVLFTQPGQNVNMPTGTSYYTCFRLEMSTSNSANTPTLTDLKIAQYSNAPKEPGININKVEAYTWPASNGALLGMLEVKNHAGIINALNAQIPDQGAGIADIQIDLRAKSSGILSLESFSITYTMQTVNLDITIPENTILHERATPYEVVSRHVIGEDASGISQASLEIRTNSIANNPTLYWESGDIFPAPNDPGMYISVDQSSYSVENNGILEIHWKFFVTSDFPDQNDVKFRVGCMDSQGFEPLHLMSSYGLRVNQTYGLGWLEVRDSDGEITSMDVPDGSWVAAGEALKFTGAMWFIDSEDAPKDSEFDVRVSRNGYVEATARDTTNNNGSFFISVDLPNINVPDGMTYEVQTYNNKNPDKVLQPNADWRRTYKVDATAPERMAVYPLEDSYEAANREQDVKILVNDDIGHPMELRLFYWVESDHDLNRNGVADDNEYASKIVTNNTIAKNKWFLTTIDTSRNPNMGRVSYFWDGGDQAGNPLHYTVMDDDDNILKFESEPGFTYDDATFRTRKDSAAIFTGLDWVGHNDDDSVYAGLTQTIELGFIDANTVIDFEFISLVFDFEGPNPLRDAQAISYSGRNDTFWSDSPYINLLPTSTMVERTNESGLPWIIVTFQFKFSWDWPDEEMGDVALLYKELGNTDPSRILLLEHTFRVENDLMLDPEMFSVEDVSEPRTGPIADGTRVRNDDRLAFTGRVVYEGSDVAAPRDVGILVEVFDGEKLWSDGSLTNDGGYDVEVPLSSARTLQSSPTRTCLISITNIPGRGEDMTGTLVSTTLQVIVDDAAPRVTRRIAPLNVIDISANNDLSKVPVVFQGTEDADLTGSKQTVHWVMRDSTRTITIGAGSTLLGMQQEDQIVTWTAIVDLTDGGRITPRAGDFVGFYITGWDAAGNQFPVVSNSEASPIPELAADDTDFERQWIQLGAVGPELRIHSISVSDDHVSPGSDITVRTTIVNNGGNTTSLFKVGFYSGDDAEPFDTVTINGIEKGEMIDVETRWTTEDGVTRVRVVVDYDNLIPEVNDFDNSAEHSIDIAYAQYFGWFDSPRENPLAWIFVFISIITIFAVVSIASRTSIDYGGGAFDEEDVEWDEDVFESDDGVEDDEEDDDEDDED